MHRIERRRHILFTWRIEILEMYSKKCFLHLLQFQYLIPYNNASNVFQPIYVQNPAQSLIESIHHNSDNLRMYCIGSICIFLCRPFTVKIEISIKRKRRTYQVYGFMTEQLFFKIRYIKFFLHHTPFYYIQLTHMLKLACIVIVIKAL